MSYRYENVVEEPFFPKKPCKSCTDFKSWSKQLGDKIEDEKVGINIIFFLLSKLI